MQLHSAVGFVDDARMQQQLEAEFKNNHSTDIMATDEDDPKLVLLAKENTESFSCEPLHMDDLDRGTVPLQCMNILATILMQQNLSYFGCSPIKFTDGWSFRCSDRIHPNNRGIKARFIRR